jgi:hypothetical protein
VPLLLLVSLLLNLLSLMILLLLGLHDKVSLNEVSLNIITGIINPLGFKTLWTERKVEWQREDLIKHSDIFFLLPGKKFLAADIIQNSAVGNFSPKTEGTKTKAASCLFF